jgi:hypothetical protein
MSRIINPIINNFKTSELLTGKLQINNKIVNSSGNEFNLPTGITGTFLLTNQLIQGSTGATGAIGSIGPTGVNGITGISSLTSATNSKIIVAYITFTGVISYQNGSSISSVSWSPTGTLNINIVGGFFSSKPQSVICNVGASGNPSNSVSNYYDYTNSTATQLLLYFDFAAVPANLDVSIMIIGNS